MPGRCHQRTSRRELAKMKFSVCQKRAYVPRAVLFPKTPGLNMMAAELGNGGLGGGGGEKERKCIKFPTHECIKPADQPTAPQQHL